MIHKAHSKYAVHVRDIRLSLTYSRAIGWQTPRCLKTALIQSLPSTDIVTHRMGVKLDVDPSQRRVLRNRFVGLFVRKPIPDLPRYCNAIQRASERTSSATHHIGQ